MPSTQSAAKAWAAKGRAVIPIPHGQKAPVLKNWQQLRVTVDNLGDYFNGEKQNLGLLLGEPSGGLVDVDLDTEAAVAVAPYFLEPTFTYGRERRPVSHYLFECAAASTRKWAYDGRMLVELRSTGCQSLIPPSVHPDGDAYRKDKTAKKVAAASAEELTQAIGRLAAAALIAEHWPEKGRHDLALTLAGALLHAGWSAEHVEAFVEACAVAAADDELADRMRAVKDTVKRHARGKTSTGWPRLAELLPPGVVEKVREWLAVEDFPELIAKPKDEQPALVSVLASEVEPRKLEPLWDGVLWIGKPTLFVGDPGKGKSLATLDIAARVTTGAPWPCDDVKRPPANVMLLSAEDDADDTVVPRLEAAGADNSRIRIITGVRGERGAIGWLALDKHWRQLAEGLAAFKPQLLVIDPLSSYMGRADTNHEGDTRRVLNGLAELAKQARVAVLAVRHFRKGAADSPQGRVIGSVAFTAAARAVYAVTPDPDDDERRLVVCLKCNLARDTFGYGFRIAATAAGDPFVQWEDEHEFRDADELLGSSAGAGTIMTCEACDKDFVAKRKDSSFCSAACKQKAYRERKKDGVTDVPDSNSRNKPSRTVTRDGSLRVVTGITQEKSRNTHREQASDTAMPKKRSVTDKRNETSQQLPLGESKYSRPCLNCGGKGCRCCDDQLRAKHYGLDNPSCPECGGDGCEQCGDTGRNPELL